MPEIVISDTSSLILLEKFGELEILQKVYGEVSTTHDVVEEYGRELPDWIIIRTVQDKKYQRLLELRVDKGEASALALAHELEDALLILDDLKARKLAKQLNLYFTGTLGVLYKAKQDGKIPLLRPIIEKLLATDFRISQNIIDDILSLSNE